MLARSQNVARLVPFEARNAGDDALDRSRRMFRLSDYACLAGEFHLSPDKLHSSFKGRRAGVKRNRPGPLPARRCLSSPLCVDTIYLHPHPHRGWEEGHMGWGRGCVAGTSDVPLEERDVKPQCSVFGTEELSH